MRSLNAWVAVLSGPLHLLTCCLQQSQACGQCWACSESFVATPGGDHVSDDTRFPCMHVQIPSRMRRSAIGIVRAAAAKVAEIASPATKTGPFKRISVQPGVLEAPRTSFACMQLQGTPDGEAKVCKQHQWQACSMSQGMPQVEPPTG